MENALLEIAKAINNLSGSVEFVGIILFLFLLLKNMGTSYDALHRIATSIQKLADKGK